MNTQEHKQGFGLSVAAAGSAAIAAGTWVVNSIVASGDSLCVRGLPTGTVSTISGGLSFLSLALGYFAVKKLSKAPSTDDSVNIKAALATGQVKS